MDVRTQFAQDFVPLSESAARDPELNLSVCAALLVSACNLTYAPVVQDDQAADALSANGAALDWFFAHAGDQVSGLNGSDVNTLI